MTILFKKITAKKDFNILQNLAYEIWTEHYISIISLNQIEYMLEKFHSIDALVSQSKENYHFYLVKLGVEHVGYFSVQNKVNGFFISKLYLMSVVRGNGIGKKMIKKITTLAKKQNADNLFLTVNKFNSQAIAFYISEGFEKIEEAQFDIGGGFLMDDFIMKKKI